MKTKTEYRIVSDGYIDFLQYKKRYTILWFINFSIWYYINDYFEGYRGFKMDCDLYVSSANWGLWKNGRFSIEEFPKHYPNIEDWYDELNEQNKKKILKEAQEEERYNNRKKKVKNL